MSKRLNKINKNEVESVLSSEVLPFETLIFFDNRNLINLYSDNIDFMGGSFKDKFTIPFDYNIKQNGKSRTLSIIHPLTQLSFVELYRDYKDHILYHTSVSNRSLRKPVSISKIFYTPKMIQKIKKIDDEILDGFENTSYFKYGPLRLAHKIYDSEFLLDMEVKYKYMKKIDISKCFYNIYTHSVVWSTHGKNFAKNNTGKKLIFSNFFDKKMQLSNYNETNGIVVGPEISRIFAEIILQRIDVNIIKTLEKENNLLVDQHYSFYRYMDDFFIFSNDTVSLDEIREVIAKELSFYKLHINISKEFLNERPFCTNITSLKNKISIYIKDFVKINFKQDNLYKLICNMESVLIEDRFDYKKLKLAIKKSKVNKFFNNDFKFDVKKNDNLYLNFISEIRMICSQSNVAVEDLSYYILKILDKNIFSILKSDRYFDQDKINIFNLFVRFYFYFFKINPEYKNFLCIASFLLYSVSLFDGDHKQEVKKVFSIHIDNLVSNFESDTVVFNSLIILSSWMGKKYEVHEKNILKIKDNFDYFSIIAGLNYCRNIKSRDELKNNFISNILSIFKRYENPIESAECFLLCADLVNCPYLEKVQKKNILNDFCLRSSIPKGNSKIDHHKLYAKLEGVAFFQWESNKIADLKKIVLSKQLLNVY